MRPLMGGLAVFVAVVAMPLPAATNQVWITFSEPQVAQLGYDTFRSQIVSVKGAVFHGGTLSSGNSTNNPRYVSGECFGCSSITIDLPPGSTDVSFDVFGYSNLVRSMYQPLTVSADGTTTQIPPV
ncbi:MAG TPA: hypothetical protein VKL19_03205, partial [Thermoanaerobaculia bacterium]|nr:hypothetical protein [Thermoanaerobaculia bacterium]